MNSSLAHIVGPILALGLLAAFFAPSFLAREKKHFLTIAAVNFFLGATVIGWIVALVWALKADSDPELKGGALWRWILGGQIALFAAIAALQSIDMPAWATSANGTGMRVAQGLVFTVVIFVIYFIPAIVGWNKRNSSSIAALDLFLGWTLIGWVVALCWALAVDDEIEAAAPESTLCSSCGKYTAGHPKFCSLCGAQIA